MALEQARSDLARLQAEIKRLESQLSSAREKAEKVANYIEMAELYSSGPGASVRVTRTRGGRSAMAADTVVEILTQCGHPIRTRDLLEPLKERGIVFDTPNPVTNLSSALSRSPRLVGDRTEGWSLSEWKEGVHDSAVSESESDEDEWSVPASCDDDDTIFDVDDEIEF